MATDTRAKRSSAIGVGLPVPSMLPDADGTVAAADRQWLTWLYSGIAAAEPVIAENIKSMAFALARRSVAYVLQRRSIQFDWW